MPFIRKHAFKIALFALCAAMGIYLLVSSRADSTQAVNFPQNSPAPEFSLQNALEDGKEVKLADSDGKVRVAYFYWSHCPDVCPATTFILSKVQDKLKEEGLFGDKAVLMSITFDPERDTPEAIRTFASKFHADPAGWLFLRNPDEAATAKLVKDYGLSLLKDTDGNFSHNDVFTLIDKKGNIRKYITGGMDQSMTPDQKADSIVTAVKSLLKK